jgi:hypothetical protein
MPTGDYVLSVKDQNKSYTRTLCHHEKAWVARISRVNTPENKYMVIVPKQLDTDLMVSVFDQYDELIFREPARCDQDFAKVYNLKNLSGGTIQVSSRQSGEAKSLKVE